MNPGFYLTLRFLEAMHAYSSTINAADPTYRAGAPLHTTQKTMDTLDSLWALGLQVVQPRWVPSVDNPPSGAQYQLHVYYPQAGS